MLLPIVPVWKQAPFIRLLVPLMLGIIAQWYLPVSLIFLAIAAVLVIILFIVTQFFRGYLLYRIKWIFGILLMCMMFLFGAYITHSKNIRYQKNWFGNFCKDSTTFIVTLQEPLIEKNKSYKAIASVNALCNNEVLQSTAGNILVYFKKDSTLLNELLFGTTLIFKRPLQPIRNTDNPGAFDYNRYCLFQSITHQVYLNRKDFSVSTAITQSGFSNWLQYSRSWLLDILKVYVPDKKEAGVAEALLIGYREDLDRDLVQAYSNTGVVHVIAISGMHLAMIYGLLIVLLKPLESNKQKKWLRGAIILSVLWIFTLLAGAGPSILRSAVMFSFIIVGESMSKQVSVYHTLSASAFFLLCYNPFFLWDVGFQLSYAAVLSIVVFLKPVTNWFYFKNKLLNYTWKLIAVTIAAQVLTTPISIYHFHQVPNLFLLSNLIIVPLSGIVLYAEILLCMVSFIPWLATLTGKAVSIMLSLMNSFIEWINSLPFAVSNNIGISIIQTIALYMAIIAIALWLMHKNNSMVKYAMAAGILFVIGAAIDTSKRKGQHSFIVYNVSQHSAMDFVHGGNYFFAGDSVCQQDDFLRNFNLSPARLLYKTQCVDSLKQLIHIAPFYYFENKRILWLHQPLVSASDLPRLNVDIIVFSHNVKTSVLQVQSMFNCAQYVFDASNPAWKIQRWKNECDSLHLRRHSVQEDGAFILDF
ncbi:MAG: ComEC/Rec2 family competence protein [Agriterribacter sp.]